MNSTSRDQTNMSTSLLFHDWATLDGSGTNPTIQDRSRWLDLPLFGDLTLWLEVRSVINPGAGTLVLTYETSPSLEDSCFVTAATITLTASATPVITKLILAANPTVPFARYLRWKVVGTQSGFWSTTFRIHAVAKRSGSGGPTLPALSNMTLRLRADLGITLNGATVSAWANQGTAGGSFTQGTASDQPTYVASALNGKPGVLFDGTNDFLTNASALSTWITASSYTAFVVFSATSITTNDASSFNNSPLLADSGGNWGQHLKSTGPTVLAFHWAGSDKHADNTIATATPYAFMHRYDGTDIVGRLGLGTRVSVAATGIGSLAGNLRIGRTWTGAAAFLNGYIHEAIVYSDAKSNDEQDAVVAYLRSFWGA